MISEAARKTLGVDAALPLRGLRDAHRANLEMRRTGASPADRVAGRIPMVSFETKSAAAARAPIILTLVTHLQPVLHPKSGRRMSALKGLRRVLPLNSAQNFCKEIKPIKPKHHQFDSRLENQAVDFALAFSATTWPNLSDKSTR
jgi:hypothetical protein